MAQQISRSERRLDVMPDTVDFRDRLFVPTLVEVPPRTDLNLYRRIGVPVLDQGHEGACTGFGLATVANFLLRMRRVDADKTPVSARMFYEIAKRYDEWPGEDYSGSSARGAVKGWHKHGVCAEEVWPYVADKYDPVLSDRRAVDALKRPLGAYFRVNHKDLVAMHSAIAEAGILFATSWTHEGWDNVGGDGKIPFEDLHAPEGGHAFAIVGYDANGLWLQNSWGPGWGKKGFGHIRYDDWLANGMDVWVVRLGAQTKLGTPNATAAMRSGAPRAYESYVYCALRPHIVMVGNNGALQESGTYGLKPADLMRILEEEAPKQMEAWNRKRILLYAHGGLVGADSAIQRVADYREAMLSSQIYPIIFVWRSDLWTTVTNILKDAIGARAEGFLDATKNFMLDRIDDTLEPVTRARGGKALWDEMKENATFATERPDGVARMLATKLVELVKEGMVDEIHIVAHSAGAIFMAPLVRLLAAPAAAGGLDTRIESCTLWAPACTTELFARNYAGLIKEGRIKRGALYTLSDAVEQDDNCAGIYNKSLLYLVSHSFEGRPRIPGFQPGVPLLGLEKDAAANATVRALLKLDNFEWVVAPDTSKKPSRSDARRHGDFDDDKATLGSTLVRIVRKGAAARRRVEGELVFRRTKQGLNRQLLQLAS